MQLGNRISPRILTATDFTKASESAFFQALALAVDRRARLTLLHIGPEGRKEVPWERFPGVRGTLVKWGLLDEDAGREAVKDQLGVNVKKMAMRDENPYYGIVDYLRKKPTDLLVMATVASRGLARLRRRTSVAESVAYRSHSHALLIPKGAAEMVDDGSGERRLSKALFVYDHEPDPGSSLPWLANWLPAFSHATIEVHMLYTGGDDEPPKLILPEHPRLEWSLVSGDGDPLRQVLRYSKEFEPEMIIMMSRRRRGLLARFKGTLCSQVLRRARRPLLLLPELH